MGQNQVQPPTHSLDRKVTHYFILASRHLRDANFFEFMSYKKLINKYNLPNSLLVITSFPEKGVTYSQHQDAVAGFAKNRLLALKNHLGDSKIIVLTTYQHKPEIYEEEGILVIRCFQRNHPRSFWRLLVQINRFNYVKNILIEFEFATFGDTLSTLFVPAILVSLKFWGKYSVLQLHQVLDNLDKLSGHIGHTKSSLKSKFFNWGLKNFYTVVVNLADQTIVLESELQTKLMEMTRSDKIKVTSLGTDRFGPKVSQTKARRTLGIKPNAFVVLSFGYITWYKGSDFAAQVFRQSPRLRRSKLELILAGGPSFTQNHKDHYRRFYQEVQQLTKGRSKIRLTGFVPEKQISLYFSAADLVIFPYRTFMSSSGPLAQTLSYGKPFLLSRPLSPYFKTPDFKAGLEKTGLKPTDLIFGLNSNDFEKKLLQIRRNHQVLAKLTKLSRFLGHRRRLRNLMEDYLIAITPSQSISTLNTDLVLAQ